MLNWLDTIAKQRDYPSREERRKRLYNPVLQEIKGRAVTQEEIGALVSTRARKLGLKGGVWTGIGEMSFLGLLVFAGKKGSRSLYMRTDDWIPRIKEPLDHHTCRLDMLRRYTAQHGTVSKEDIMYWAYLNRQQLDMALADLSGEIVELKLGPSKNPTLTLISKSIGRFHRLPRQ